MALEMKHKEDDSMKFERYEEVPKANQQKIIDDAKNDE